MKLYNIVKVYTSTVGTGTVTLGSAVPSFITFATAGVVNGSTVSYAIEDGNNREVGTGTYTSGTETLTRNVVTSTNSNNLITLSGNAVVFITGLAADLSSDTANVASTLIQRDGSGNFAAGAATLSSAVVPLVIGGTGTTSTLTLRSTSGVGTAGADIIFQTGNNGATEVMRLQNGGNVGIGTASPASRLNVRNTSLVADAGIVQLLSRTDGPYLGIGHQNWDGTHYAAIGGTVTDGSNNTLGALRFFTRQSSTDANLTERMRIDSSGNVGIGATPNTKLEVAGTIRSSSSGATEIQLVTSSATTSTAHILGSLSNSGFDFANLIISSNTTRFNISGGEKMRIDSSGSVCINTTANGGFNLNVNGSTNLGGTSVVDTSIELNAGGTGNRFAFIDFHGDDTYTDFGLRIIRDNSGPNAYSTFEHRGTGFLLLKTSEAAPIVFFTNGNNERMRIDSSGNVGIGTSSPGTKLDILGANGTTQQIYYRSSDTNWYGRIGQIVSGNTIGSIISSGGAWSVSGATFSATKDFNGSFPTAALYIGNQYNSALETSFRFLRKAAGSTTTDGAVTELMTIDNSGNVGIGTSSPSHKLELGGGGGIVSSYLYSPNNDSLELLAGTSFSSSGAAISLRPSTGGYNDHGMEFYTGGGEKMRISSSGNVSIGNTDNSYKLDVTGTAGTWEVIRIRNLNSGNSALIRATGAGGGSVDFGSHSTANTFVVNIAGSERMRIDSSGNVGIGTTSPGYKLHVLGADGFGAGTAAAAIATSTTGNSATTLELLTGSGSAFDISLFAAGASPANAVYFNNRNSAPMVFLTGNSERMRIDSSGLVGIGKTGPTAAIDVLGPASTTAGRILGNANAAIVIDFNASGDNYYDASNHIFRSAGGSPERMRIDSVGNVKVGGTADRATTAGTNQVVIFNGTAPVGTLANGCSFYSTAGEMRVMDAAGNATLLSPHDSVTNEWIYDSSHTPSGKRLKINVERLLRFINDHFGLDCVHDLMEEA